MRFPWQKKQPNAQQFMDGIVEEVADLLGTGKNDPDRFRAVRAVKDDLTDFLMKRFNGRTPSDADATKAIYDFRDQAKKKFSK